MKGKACVCHFKGITESGNRSVRTNFNRAERNLGTYAVRRAVLALMSGWRTPERQGKMTEGPREEPDRGDSNQIHLVV